MKPSAIGWTDYSGGALNLVTGCTSVSESCQNCYARAIYQRFGKDFSRVTIHEDRLAKLARMKFGLSIRVNGRVEYVSPKHEGHKPMCFVCDTGDLFHEDVPDGFIREAFTMMRKRQDVIWQVLTKRPERMLEHMRSNWTYEHGGAVPMPNVWLGVTAENQRRADERIPLLLQTPAAVRFVSVEPMLGPVYMADAEYSWLTCTDKRDPDESEDSEYDCCESMATTGNHYHGIDWVICGAESGPNRRPFNKDWAHVLYLQCRNEGIPFFGKQDSGLRPGTPLLLDGKVVHEWPGVG